MRITCRQAASFSGPKGELYQTKYSMTPYLVPTWLTENANFKAYVDSGVIVIMPDPTARKVEKPAEPEPETKEPEKEQDPTPTKKGK